MNFAIFSWIFLKNFINMTHVNLLRSLQITLVTEIGDIVTQRQANKWRHHVALYRGATSSKKFRAENFWIFVKFSYLSRKSQNLKKNSKISTKDFGKITRKIVFGNLFIDRFHCLQEMNDDVTLTSWWRHFKSLLGTFTGWI